MSSPVPDIPARFIDPRMKYPLMQWLVSLGLPARVTRGVLQHWGVTVGVAITPVDYQMIEQRQITPVVEPRPEQE